MKPLGAIEMKNRVSRRTALVAQYNKLVSDAREKKRLIDLIDSQLDAESSRRYGLTTPSPST